MFYSNRVVALGGGHGLSALLHALLALPVELTAIVSVMDDGGSSGQLRQNRGVLPPGDLRRCLLALSELEPDWLEILEQRFLPRDNCSLSGHPVGNLLLAALFEQYPDNPVAALHQACRLLKTRGAVLPVTASLVELEGIRIDGKQVRGEVNVAKTGPFLHHLTLVPDQPPAAPGVLEAIQAADVIILGPGSLYTSVLPPLLVGGIADALRTTGGRVVYLCNPTTQPGETDGMTALHHVQVLEAHLGSGIFEDVLVNTEPSTDSQMLGFVQPETLELRDRGYTVHRGHYWSFAMGRSENPEGLLEIIRSFLKKN